MWDEGEKYPWKQRGYIGGGMVRNVWRCGEKQVLHAVFFYPSQNDSPSDVELSCGEIFGVCLGEKRFIVAHLMRGRGYAWHREVHSSTQRGT